MKINNHIEYDVWTTGPGEKLVCKEIKAKILIY